MNKVFRWIKTNSTLLSNAASLIGSTGITSILGFAYWWLAARYFPPAAVGFASAAISAMTLFGTFGILGLGTLLVGELPRQPGRETPLISTALILVGGVGLGLGCIFAAIAPYISASLGGLGADIENVILFALGVSFTAITLVLDQALIGLLQGGVQLWRNALFAAVKLAALFLLSIWLSRATGIAIYSTWTIGNAISLLVLLGVALVRGVRLGRNVLPQFELLRKLGVEAIKQHALNLTLQAPPLILPVLVTIALSATANAWFYISWSLASIGNIIASSFTLVLYALSTSQPQMLARKMRLTLGLSFAACAAVNVVFLFDSQQILGFFGHSYAEQAVWSFRILSVESFPFIIKTHYIAVRRIRGLVVSATLITVATGLLELGGSALGVYLGGLTGLGLGWLTAMCIEAAFMSPAVYTATRITKQFLRSRREALFAEDLDNLGTLTDGQQTDLVDTLIQPVWLADTLTLAAIGLPRKASGPAFAPDDEDKNEVYSKPTIRLASFPRNPDLISTDKGDDPVYLMPTTPLPDFLQDEEDEKTVKLPALKSKVIHDY